jgi:SacI homology domain
VIISLHCTVFCSMLMLSRNGDSRHHRVVIDCVIIQSGISHTRSLTLLLPYTLTPTHTISSQRFPTPPHQSRYLKRGISIHGKVANDCEIEQIVQLDSGVAAQFCSYLQMRGSIPTYWYVIHNDLQVLSTLVRPIRVVILVKL